MVSVMERECVLICVYIYMCVYIYICHLWHGGCKGKTLGLASWLFGDFKTVGTTGY